ncbi:YceH family protein [Pseudomonas sp. Marseille-QA0892]
MTEDVTFPYGDEPLSPVEIRVLGCLIEKQLTTPESYPLTLNAVLLAANQKTSRDPIMTVQQGEAGKALRRLEERGLVRLVMGSRADRWEQRTDKVLELVASQVVLLGLLLLRGPQTTGELLTRSSRMHAFDDTDEVKHQLERLAARGLVQQLPRQVGQREERYMHQMGNAADREAMVQAAANRTSGSEQPVESERIGHLEERIATLEARLTALERALGADANE